MKIDQNFGEKTKVSFYWSQWRQDRNKNTFDGLPFPISPAREYIDRTPTYRLTIDRTMTPTLLLHLGGGVVHYVHTDSSPQSVLQYDAVKELGLVGASVTPSGFPRINGLSGSQGGMSSTIGPTNAGTYFNDKPTLVGSLTWIRSSHTWKFGGEWQKDIWSNVTAGNTMGAYAFQCAGDRTAVSADNRHRRRVHWISLRELPFGRGRRRHDRESPGFPVA